MPCTGRGVCSVMGWVCESPYKAETKPSDRCGLDVETPQLTLFCEHVAEAGCRPAAAGVSGKRRG